MKEWESRKYRHREDLKEKQIISFLLIRFHMEMAWKPTMLSNHHHSCHNNNLNQGVWLSSCFIEDDLGENTTSVTLELLICCWWPLLSKPSLPPQTQCKTAEQIDSSSTKNKTCSILEKVNLTQEGKRIQSFLSVCMTFDQLSSWASQGFYRLYPPLSQMRNNVLYSITV